MWVNIGNFQLCAICQGSFCNAVKLRLQIDCQDWLIARQAALFEIALTCLLGKETVVQQAMILCCGP